MENKKNFKKEIKRKLISYVVAAIGLIAGLAWNDAVKELIGIIFPLERDTVVAKFIYAIFIAVILVVMTLYLNKILKEKE